MQHLCVSTVPLAVIFLKQNVIQSSEVVNEPSGHAQSFDFFLRQRFNLMTVCMLPCSVQGLCLSICCCCS